MSTFDEIDKKSSRLQSAKSTGAGSRETPIAKNAKPTFTALQLIEFGHRAVENNKRTLGPEHPETLKSMFNLGLLYHTDLKIERALQVFQTLLALRERILGRDHDDTLITLDAVAEELCNLGKYEPCLERLIDLRKRCERSLGMYSERSLCVRLDIAGVMKLLGRTIDATTTLKQLAASCTSSAQYVRHLHAAVAHDLRCASPPAAPDTKEWGTLLRLNRIDVPSETFPNTSSITFPEMLAEGDTLAGSSSVGYEAANAIMLRLRSYNAVSAVKAPLYIPPDNPVPGTIRLVETTTQHQEESPFQTLIVRSIAAMPQKLNSEDQRAQHLAYKHITFLKGLKSLEELLTSDQHLVWFFQRRASFMEQQTILQWNENCLERYILLPVEGNFVNSKDCIFVSHYWQTPKHPDPDGSGLRKLHSLLKEGYWNEAQYVWVDWTCLPQGKRTTSQQRYFSRALQTIPRLVRDCSFVAAFEEFRPRIWVLFEVASYIFDRDRGVGLHCTDTFKAHLLQMKGSGAKSVLEKYNYTCSSKDDYSMVVSWLEILLALNKTVPSSHTRRQILDAIDKPHVKACTHTEVDVKIDKERGTIKTEADMILFTPLPVEDEATEISVAGDFETRLKEAYQRADASFDDAGVGEIAREYDRAGEHRLGEALHRRAIAQTDTYANSSYLTENLEQQQRFKDALAQVQRDRDRGFAPVELEQNHIRLIQKQAQAYAYGTWVSQPLEKSLDLEAASTDTQGWKAPPYLKFRHGLRRDFLQRLDLNTWKHCIDPVVLKSVDEGCHEMEGDSGLPAVPRALWVLLKRRKETLGPNHPDTRKTLAALARVFRKLNQLSNAHQVYGIALTVCDASLGPHHPESRAVLASLAELCLLEKKPGVARGYFRQLLERSLAVAPWDSDETYQARYFLQALIGPNCILKINQLEESTTVEILGYSENPQRPTKDTPKSHGSRSSQPRKPVLHVIDLENADQFLSRTIRAA